MRTLYTLQLLMYHIASTASGIHTLQSYHRGDFSTTKKKKTSKHSCRIISICEIPGFLASLLRIHSRTTYRHAPFFFVSGRHAQNSAPHQRPRQTCAQKRELTFSSKTDLTNGRMVRHQTYATPKPRPTRGPNTSERGPVPRGSREPSQRSFLPKTCPQKGP